MSDPTPPEVTPPPGWAMVDGRLHREFEFADFAEAWGFMTRVALAAEKADHHPDWSNSYNKVVIDLIDHHHGAVSRLDLELAARIDELLA